MSDMKPVNNSRRSFITKGGAAIGAGLASASAAGTSLLDRSPPPKAGLEQLQKQLDVLADREAIHHLHLTYSILMENRAYDDVVELFTEDASVELYGETFTGKRNGVSQLFLDQYGGQKAAVIQTAYLRDQSQRQDQLTIDDDGQHASATFHARVQVSKPLQDQSVPGTMAKLQGMSASTAWENGRFTVDYARVEGQWHISSLKYLRA